MHPRQRISVWFVVWIIACGVGHVDLHAASTTEEQTLPNGTASDSSAVDTVPRSALLRSILVPGWGQYYNKRYFKSVLIFGTSCGLALGMVYEHQQLQRSATEAERSFYRSQRNTFAIWLLGTILYGMADAYVDAHLRDFDKEMEEMVLRIDLECRSQRPFLVYRIPW